MQDKINIGIIGLGHKGMHRKTIAENHPDLNLVAVSDAHRPNIPRQEKYRYYEDYRKLLDSDIDAVFVAPPNKYRSKVVIDALERGKHVFCEIPPGRTIKDIQNIVNAEKKAKGSVLAFGFTHRFNGAVLKAEELIKTGTFGKILWMKAVYGKSGGNYFESIWQSNREWAGGGILLGEGIHILDLFLFFFAGSFTEVKSFVSTSFWNVPVEDNAFALLRNAQNQIAAIHASATHWKNRYSLEICLEKGYITIEGTLSPEGVYISEEKLAILSRQSEDEKSISGLDAELVTCFKTYTSWEREMDAFFDCIKDGTKIKNGSSRDALNAMKLVDCIYHKDTRWWQRWKSTR
ncbi:MAG: Gfo/Idh/MocA family oxidoreductase [Methanoregula sp.]